MTNKRTGFTILVLIATIGNALVVPLGIFGLFVGMGLGGPVLPSLIMMGVNVVKFILLIIFAVKLIKINHTIYRWINIVFFFEILSSGLGIFLTKKGGLTTDIMLTAFIVNILVLIVWFLFYRHVKNAESTGRLTLA